MADTSKFVLELKQPEYVPIIRDHSIAYGGNQQWFSSHNTNHTHSNIYRHGSAIIATSDVLLYLALLNDKHRNPITNLALQDSESIHYIDYLTYVNYMEKTYIQYKRWFPKQGYHIARAINQYAKCNKLPMKASWLNHLNYYTMLDYMESMILRDIPVILSIGPNSLNPWGFKGCSLYQQYQLLPQIPTKQSTPTMSMDAIFRYREIHSYVNRFFLVVTEIKKVHSSVVNKSSTMLRVSFYGRSTYLNYDEYWEYITEYASSASSGMLMIQ